MVILLHSSKTMRPLPPVASHSMPTPLLSDEADILASYLKTLSVEQIQSMMKISPTMAIATHALIQQWSTSNPTLPAIDIFLGDIYSGLQAHTLSEDDRAYAQEHLFILSGLYGAVRALDGIQPYRLEMGYKLPGDPRDVQEGSHEGARNATSPAALTSLYAYWGDKIAKIVPKSELIINLSAIEYTKALFPHLKSLEKFNNSTIITPKFLTVSPKTGEPTFVTVHAKVARGAFARWLVLHRIENAAQLRDFNEIGYEFNEALSTDEQPVFVAKAFKGIGLSVRLS